MREPYDGQTLFGPSGSRKHLNAAERQRFLESAQQLPPPERLFCLTLGGAARASRKCSRTFRPRSTSRAGWVRGNARLSRGWGATHLRTSDEKKRDRPFRFEAAAAIKDSARVLLRPEPVAAERGHHGPTA